MMTIYTIAFNVDSMGNKWPDTLDIGTSVSSWSGFDSGTHSWHEFLRLKSAHVVVGGECCLGGRGRHLL